ncbi:MAG TPA: glucose 1-dehydrogenase [Thermoplasmata archaeon]|nr:glucose 1-dehydrogenase [Thermoplasmata archaeon]
MRALLVHPPQPGVRLGDTPDPTPGPSELLVRVRECGVCGTDRDIVSGLYGRPPSGRDELILGHENLGVVEAVGPSVQGFAVGDLVVATVRRSCGICRFCLAGRSDFCESGKFTERGIGGADGYFAEKYAEHPEYVVRVPPELSKIGVLLEPLSVVEKALDEGTVVLGRREPTVGYPPEHAPSALVAGTGAVGLLAAFCLRARGWDVTAVDRHDGSPTADLLGRIGARHLNVAGGWDAVGERQFDLALEATGSADLDVRLLPTLRPNGVVVLTGIPPANGGTIPVALGALLRDLVLENQAIVGSVNANRSYFERGVQDLATFREKFGDAIDRLIGERRPWTEFAKVLLDRPSGAPKSVLVVSS